MQLKLKATRQTNLSGRGKTAVDHKQKNKANESVTDDTYYEVLRIIKQDTKYETKLSGFSL